MIFIKATRWISNDSAQLPLFLSCNVNWRVDGPRVEQLLKVKTGCSRFSVSLSSTPRLLPPLQQPEPACLSCLPALHFLIPACQPLGCPSSHAHAHTHSSSSSSILLSIVSEGGLQGLFSSENLDERRADMNQPGHTYKKQKAVAGGESFQSIRSLIKVYLHHLSSCDSSLTSLTRSELLQYKTCA